MNLKIYEINDITGEKNALSEYLYGGADSCLLVYDITNLKSFDECKNYYNKKIKEICRKDIKVVLLGNKTDLEDKRQIIYEECFDFAYENNYIFMEISYLENEKVSDVFETLIGITDGGVKKNNKGNYILNAKKHNKRLNKYLSY